MLYTLFLFLYIVLDTLANLSYDVNGSNAIISWDTPLNGGMISSYFVRHTFCNEDEEHIKEYSLNETTTKYILTDFDYSVTNNITVIASNGIWNSSTSILTNITGENMKYRYIPHNNYTFLSS